MRIQQGKEGRCEVNALIARSVEKDELGVVLSIQVEGNCLANTKIHLSFSPP
jgi:hypothetical protein